MSNLTKKQSDTIVGGVLDIFKRNQEIAKVAAKKAIVSERRQKQLRVAISADHNALNAVGKLIAIENLRRVTAGSPVKRITKK